MGFLPTINTFNKQQGEKPMKHLLITAMLALFLTACASTGATYNKYRADGMTHTEAMELIDAGQRSLEAQLQWNAEQMRQQQDESEHTTIWVR
jgi:hypothetical protein